MYIIYDFITFPLARKPTLFASSGVFSKFSNFSHSISRCSTPTPHTLNHQNPSPQPHQFQRFYHFPLYTPINPHPTPLTSRFPLLLSHSSPLYSHPPILPKIHIYPPSPTLYPIYLYFLPTTHHIMCVLSSLSHPLSPLVATLWVLSPILLYILLYCFIPYRV